MDTFKPERNQPNSMCLRNEVLKLNASLAVKVAYQYLKKQHYFPKNVNFCDFFNDKRTQFGLLNCNWPGRYHQLEHKNINFHLDGAHTDESIQLCVEWFKNMISTTNHPTYLLFNLTRNRSFDKKLLALSKIGFDYVIFLSNVVDDDPNNKSKSNFHIIFKNKIKKKKHPLYFRPYKLPCVNDRTVKAMLYKRGILEIEYRFVIDNNGYSFGQKNIAISTYTK